MKKVLTFLLLLSAMCITETLAQTRIPREVHLGFIGGANMSEYTFHPRVSQKFTTGYTAGIAARYIEETYFGLQAELLLTQRFYADAYDAYPELNFSRELTYVELPVMAHIYFKMGNRNEVAFDAGPKLAYFLSDKIDSNLPDDFGQSGSEYTWDVTAHHSLAIDKKLDYGIQAGLGYEFKFSRLISLQLQARYYFGLGNLWPDSKSDDFEQSSNQSIQFVMSLWWHHTIRGKKIKPQGKTATE